MKFEISTSGYFYADNYKIKLSKLGFNFRSSKHFMGWIIDKSDLKVEINSLDKLLEFSKKWGPIILDGNDMSIEIYDDYRE